MVSHWRGARHEMADPGGFEALIVQGWDLSLLSHYKISDAGGRELTWAARCQTKVDRYRNGIIQGR
jgi:hypothetical protein